MVCSGYWVLGRLLDSEYPRYRQPRNLSDEGTYSDSRKYSALKGAQDVLYRNNPAKLGTSGFTRSDQCKHCILH